MPPQQASPAPSGVCMTLGCLRELEASHAELRMGLLHLHREAEVSVPQHADLIGCAPGSLVHYSCRWQHSVHSYCRGSAVKAAAVHLTWA